MRTQLHTSPIVVKTEMSTTVIVSNFSSDEPPEVKTGGGTGRESEGNEDI